MLLEICLLPTVKNYAEATRYARQWMAGARSGDPAEPESLRVHYLAGVAALEFARGLRMGDTKRGESLASAQKSLEFVARHVDPWQREAQRMLADPLFGDWLGEASLPSSYAEGKYHGDCAWERMVRAQSILREQRQPESRTTPEEAARQQQEFRRGRDSALRCYRLALGLASPKVPLEELNALRFRLAYLCWAAGDFERAEVLGEFLARSYPQSNSAPCRSDCGQGVSIALPGHGNGELPPYVFRPAGGPRRVTNHPLAWLGGGRYCLDDVDRHGDGRA